MVAAVVRTAEPAHVERAAVIVVMGVNGKLAADFTGLPNEAPAQNRWSYGARCFAAFWAPSSPLSLGVFAIDRAEADRSTIFVAERIGLKFPTAAPADLDFHGRASLSEATERL